MASVAPRDRLVQLAQAHGESLSALSRMIGKNPAYLQQFVKRGTPRKLEEEDRARLARFFGVNEVELIGEKEISYELKRSSPARKEREWIDVPRLDVGASAGPGALMGAERPFGALRFAERWLRSLGLQPDRLSAITVQGDSMEPTLRDGDEILVDTTPHAVRDGIHVVRLGETLLVKRLETGVAGRIALLSDNPAYRALECEAAEVHVVGRVVWKGGRL